METLNFALLGLGNSAVFAALALALVVNYRGSATVNFAAGAIALYAAYTYAGLRAGEFLVPIPGLTGSVHLADSLPLVPAMLGAIAAAAALGGLLHVLVFRHLRTATPVARAVASVGVMLTIQAVLALRLGTEARPVSAIFPSDIYEFAGVRVAASRLWTMVAISAIALAVGVGYRATRFGLATTAVAETEVGAAVSGVSVDRVAALNWMASSAIAGAGGVLVAPIVPLSPVSYTLFVVPALAGALAARFTSLGIAVGVAAGIGVGQSGLVKLSTEVPTFDVVRLPELLPLLLIIGVLFIHGAPLPTRGVLLKQVVAAAPRPHRVYAPAAGWTAIAIVALVVLDGGYRGAMIGTLIMAIIMLSFVVVTGFLGQMSLAQMALAGVGAFTVSHVSGRWGVPFPFAPLLATAAAAAVGFVVGLPSLRVRGYSVAIATLALAAALDAVWFRNNRFNGGSAGARPDNPVLFGLNLGVGQGRDYPRLAFGVMVALILAATAIGVAKLRGSRLGEAMLAISTNERSAAASGVEVARVKLMGFVIGAALAGLGGSLLAYHQTSVSADSYAPLVGLTVFTTAYFAGVTSVTGGVLAGVLAQGGIVWLVSDRALGAGRWFPLIGALGLLITVLVHPNGIAGDIHHALAKRRLRRTPSPALPTFEDHALSQLEAGHATHSGSVVLSLEDVGVRYGAVVAVSGVTLDLREGQIAGIIGPNGAGKSSLVDAITGFVHSEGTTTYRGDPIDATGPAERARRGIVRTFQAIELYDGLSVRENLEVGAIAARRKGHTASPAIDIDRAAELLGLREIAYTPVAELSHGHRQLVAIGRALASAPSVLLLDEPAAGLDRNEVTWLADRLRAIRDSGVAIALIDHDIDFVLDLCDVVHVLDLGELIVSGAPVEVRSHPRVIEAYLGISRHVDATPPALGSAGPERRTRVGSEASMVASSDG